jgi:hypothetical protein
MNCKLQIESLKDLQLNNDVEQGFSPEDDFLFF